MTIANYTEITFWYITTDGAHGNIPHLVKLWSDSANRVSEWHHNEYIALHVQRVATDEQPDQLPLRHDILSAYRISDRKLLRTTKRLVPKNDAWYSVTRDHVFSTSNGKLEIWSLTTLQIQFTSDLTQSLGEGSFHRRRLSVSEDGSLCVIPMRSRAHRPINDGLIVFDARARRVYKCFPGPSAVAFHRPEGMEEHTLSAYTMEIF
jgi:hypothetical protein